MSKKNKPADKSGTYALCITVGVVVGIGIGPALGSVPISAAIGIAGGAIAGYLLANRKPTKKKHH